MPLELKDLASQKVLVVPEDGLTFGREGGDANIQLRDTGVSKRHARVFGENGAWFLEDLGSSNGTWLQKERIKDATELLPGDVFQMSQAKYEVLQATNDDAGEPTSMQPDEDSQMDDAPPEDEVEPTPKPAAKEPPAKAAKGAAKDKENSVSKQKVGAAPAPSKKMAAAGGKNKDEANKKTEAGVPDAAADAGGGGEPKKITVGYFLIAVPKAFAFYLAAIPVMLLNPIGTIRKAVKEQKHEAKGRMELIAWALPAQLIGAAFGFLGGLIYGLVTHTLSVGDILPIGRLIGAVIGAIITGIVWHPFFNWWVKFLKGTSDDRSRTNLFLLVQTATALLAFPAFVAQVLGLVPLPLIGLVPLVLSLASSLIMLFIWFSWFSEAGVVKWFRIVLMVLGGLACLSTLAGIPAAIAGRGSVGGSGGSVDAQVAAAEAQAEALRKQAEAQAEVAEKQADAAAAAAEKQLDKAQAAADKAEKQAEKAEKAVAAAPPPVEDKKAPPPPPEKAAPPPPPAKGADPAPVAAAAAPTGAGYGAWHSKWEAVEKRITDDPTVLNKDPSVLNLYKKLVDEMEDAEAKFAKSKDPRRVRDHLRDAEMYEKTEKTVNELYGKLFK
ncbi:MAG: FHA domain-containing protein [Myxococcaceae bacterium]|nr:FHA domain-containing protein [Myxococcaceae bacterium]